MAERPTGAVAFLFTDIEGSTAAWEDDPNGMAADLEVHDRILREAIESNGGFVFATGGDSFSAAFSSPTSALVAAAEAQRGLAESECGLRVRMGVHSGEAVERDGNYFGPALNRTARLMSIGHGGQILVSVTTRELVTGGDFEFVDLGEHRLADMAAPVRIAQLLGGGLDQDFPSLRSVVATDNLPRLGEVFGRDSDIEALIELLGDHRLVTLTGAGGIGKTTLATSVAHRMTEVFPDGRWLVDLTDLPSDSDRTAISGAVAGVDDRFGSVEALAPRQMLLVLDNCEHVLDGVRSYLSDLLDTALQMTVLATSREPIGIRQEWAMPVEPLSVDDDSTHASAVDLFVDRASRAGVTLDIDADRDTIAAICQQVGGLPLAIELAAARTAVMTPGQILDRLEDRLSVLRGGRGGPEHHRTIEATIAWSYDLLDEDTKKLLRLLSVFEGGCDLEQAEAVGSDRAIDRLADLVRKSLVHRNGDRFGMLEAVRQYANARLREIGEEDEARRLHFEFYADWAHQVYRRDDLIELDLEERGWVTTNLVNLHAAVRWGADHGSPVEAAEIADTLWHHLVTVRLGKPQPNWYEPLLDHLDDLPTQLRLGVLHGAGTVDDWVFDNPDRALGNLEAAYEIHVRTGLLTRAGGNPPNALGMLADKQGRWDDAIRWYRAGAELGAGGGLVAEARLVGTLWATSRVEESEILEMIQTKRNKAPKDQLYIGTILLDLFEAAIRVRKGETEQPRRLLTPSLTALREADARHDLQFNALSVLSAAERNEGHHDASATLLLEAIDLAVSHGLHPLWRGSGEAIRLADTLVDVGYPSIASRVVTSFHNSNTVALKPLAEHDLHELDRRIERSARDSVIHAPDEERVPLVDAVRQALETATR